MRARARARVGVCVCVFPVRFAWQEATREARNEPETEPEEEERRLMYVWPMFGRGQGQILVVGALDK